MTGSKNKLSLIGLTVLMTISNQIFSQTKKRQDGNNQKRKNRIIGITYCKTW